MIYNILEPYFADYPFTNIFRYISFRSGCAIFTSLIISFLIGPNIIKFLKSKQKFGQPIRDDGPKSHIKNKSGTPPMGGIMIIISMLVSIFLWTDLKNEYVWLAVFSVVLFAFVGMLDDALKLKRNNHRGISAKLKISLQLIFSLIIVLWLHSIVEPAEQNLLNFPLFKNLIINLGWFYIPFAIIVIIGGSNSVNLTDGLDGLAIVPIMIVAASFALISYFVGNVLYSDYLHLTYIPGSGELTVICATVVGSSLGFLWFNAPPAKIFMGDTGSLSLGALLAVISLITKHEIVLAIIGGLFVMEAVSVIIQVYSFKLTGKRVFRMAPIHHHYEQKGWPESTIVIRFWIISIILALIGLATLKIR